MLHFILPLLPALAGLVLALRNEALSVDLIFVQVGWSACFYTAPHILWAVICTAIRPALVVWHAGFVTSSLALFLVGALSALGSRDPSGLPYQWLVYWPLSGVLLIAVLVGWFLKGRPHASV